jgi:hypothetical protein
MCAGDFRKLKISAQARKEMRKNFQKVKTHPGIQQQCKKMKNRIIIKRKMPSI